MLDGARLCGDHLSRGEYDDRVLTIAVLLPTPVVAIFEIRCTFSSVHFRSNNHLALYPLREIDADMSGAEARVAKPLYLSAIAKATVIVPTHYCAML